MVEIRDNNVLIGGGSLIAPDIVLTLARLFHNSTMDNLRVVAGEWDTESEQEVLPHLSRSVASIIKHPEFDGRSNDIALVVLRIGFSSQPNIRTICLPTPVTVIDHGVCLSAAWTNKGNGKPTKSQFQIQTQNVCELRLHSVVRSNPTTLCAIPIEDSTSIRSVVVNSGAALVCPMKGNPNRYTQTGIVIGIFNEPGLESAVFVNVTQFMPWIFKNLGPLNTDLKYYLP